MLCLKTKYILLQGLTGLPVIESEDDVKTKYSKGSLEIGLDSLLQACNKHLLSLSIIDCSNLITDRSVFISFLSGRHPTGPKHSILGRDERRRRVGVLLCVKTAST